MDLATITAGGDLEVVIFWSIGAFVLGVGALDTWYMHGKKDRNYDL